MSNLEVSVIRAKSHESIQYTSLPRESKFFVLFEKL